MKRRGQSSGSWGPGRRSLRPAFGRLPPRRASLRHPLCHHHRLLSHLHLARRLDCESIRSGGRPLTAVPATRQVRDGFQACEADMGPTRVSPYGPVALNPDPAMGAGFGGVAQDRSPVDGKGRREQEGWSCEGRGRTEMRRIEADTGGPGGCWRHRGQDRGSDPHDVRRGRRIQAGTGGGMSWFSPRRAARRRRRMGSPRSNCR